MFPAVNKFALLLVCTCGLAVSAGHAQVHARPVPDKGAGARTLVLYSGIHIPYSLADDFKALKLQLRRVAVNLEDMPVSEVDTSKVAAADYVVVFCPQPMPVLPPQLLQALADRKDPVLWVGYGSDQLAQLAPFKGQFSVAKFAAEKPAALVAYNGKNWKESIAFWIPAQVTVSPGNRVIMTVPLDDASAAPQPFAWKTAHTTFFTALPTHTTDCALFSDLLLDFFGVNSQAPSAVGIRIDGYHCRQDHDEFRNLVKYLSEREVPFIVGVIPAYYDPVKDKILDLDTQPEFVAALRFAQQHGGRLIMQGYLSADKGRLGQPEFWDSVSDHALTLDNAERARERIEKGLSQMFARGLFPLGWSTPRYAGSRATYGEIASHFSTSIERVQTSETTALDNFAGSAGSLDDYGRTIVPENLGAATGLWGPLARIQARAEVLTQLRDTISLCAFPAHLGEGKLTQVVKLLEQLHTPFLDLAAGSHWVQTSGTLLLTGDAKRSVMLNNARVLWRAYDRAGKLLAEEVEPTPTTGERVFERRGKGDYELFQFNQGTP